jgi:hypothetical protein
MRNFCLFVVVVAMVGMLGATSHAALLSDYTFDSAPGGVVADIVNGKNGSLSGSGILVAGPAAGTPYSWGGGTISADSVVGGGSLLLTGGDTCYVALTTDAYPNNTAGLITGSTSFWIKTTAPAANYPGGEIAILGSNGATGFGNTNDQMFEINLATDTSPTSPLGLDVWERAYSGGRGTFSGPFLATTNLNDGSWHQVTATWNATTTGAAGSGNGVIFIDGVKYDTGGDNHWGKNDMTAAKAAAVTTWANPLAIGTHEGLGAAFGDAGANLPGKLDDLAIWSTRLTDTQASALYHVSQDLGYNAKDINVLFSVFAAGPSGHFAPTSDNTNWYWAGALAGTPGTVINGGTAVVLDAFGNGVTSIPEPGTLSLLAAAAIGLLCYAWRKRK